MTSILVVGAGIGGLSLALELHARGHECRVLEAAPQAQPVGVGLNIQPYAVRELHRLGLEAELRRASVLPHARAYASSAGQILLREPLGLNAGLELPQYSIHRAALQAILLKAVQDRLGANAVLFGHRLVRFEQDRDGVAAMFDNGRPPLQADILVGCDGVHSTVYRQLFPAGADLQTPGITLWRGIAKGISLLDQRTAFHCGQVATGKLVAYPVRHPDAPDEIVMNWVLELRRTGDEPQRGIKVMPAAIPGLFRSWALGWINVGCLIRQSEAILQMPMADRDPLPRWSHDRVTLLGDAAHPMYPIGSNGAGQAILDAAALAACLEADEPVAGLRAYDELRRPAANAVVRSDRAGGSDVVLNAIHEITNGEAIPADREREVEARLRDALAAYRAGVLSAGRCIATHRR